MNVSIASSDPRLLKGIPTLTVEPGATLRLLVLAADGGHCAAVDLASGTLVRAWSAHPAERPFQAYDVVDVTLDENPDAVPDPSEPEALVLAEPPRPVGRIIGRKAERLLRPLLHPLNAPLLGFHAPALLFWERSADHPSIALVEPESPIELRREYGYLACRFYWQGLAREFPCLDREVAEDMDRRGRPVARAPRGSRLVVALTPPIDGHCHKVVESVLARP